MKFSACALRAVLTLAALALLPLGHASAAGYPDHPVRIIVGYPPGGSTDISARLFGQWLSEKLHQQFIVENKPGAGNNIGTEVAHQVRAGRLHAVSGQSGQHHQRHAVQASAASTSSTTRRRSPASCACRT